MRTKPRTLLATFTIVVLGGLMWLHCPDRRSRRTTERDHPPMENATTMCAGWPEQVPTTAEGLEPFLSPGFRNLLRRDTLRAWDAFSRLPDAPGARAGLLRAQLGTGQVLRAARDLAFASLRDFLDRRIADNLNIGAGEEIVPLVRAALALQSGETNDIRRWTARIPEQSPLFRAARWLDATSSQAPTGQGPDKAALWWRDQLTEWQHALEVQGCAVDTRTAVRRLGVLARWTRDLPPPRAWRKALNLGSPDFTAGGCSEDITNRLEIFDPSLYTVLSVSTLEALARRSVQAPLDRYFVLRAQTMLGLDATAVCQSIGTAKPEQATTGSAVLPYLIYGDQLTAHDMLAWVARTCEGAADETPAPCPGDGDAVRQALEQQVKWEKSCVAWLSSRDQTRGKMAETYHFYGGAARARYFRPLQEGRCKRDVLLQAYQFWKGRLDTPNPWWSLEARIRWVELEARGHAFRDGPAEVFLMAERDAVFFPLSEMVRAAQLAVRPNGGGLLGTMR